VTGSTSETVGDLSHVANIPIDTSSGREIVETTITKTVTISNSNEVDFDIPVGIPVSIDAELSFPVCNLIVFFSIVIEFESSVRALVTIGPVVSIVFFSIFMELLSGDVTVTEAGISKSTSTVISSGSQIMGDNSMKDVGISDVVTQTEVSKTSIGDVVSGANEESVDTSNRCSCIDNSTWRI
jgi:uncharacterized MnhB-related membrane protein